MQYTCCFFGHRKIAISNQLKINLYKEIEKLILEKDITAFLFGSKSEFDDLCHTVVTKLKENYPHIKRIYVRAEYPFIDENYKSYILKDYEDTYFPERVINAGKFSYIERNFEMIDRSGVCIVYYNPAYKPAKKSEIKYQPKSGTKIAYGYAVGKKLKIINLAE